MGDSTTMHIRKIGTIIAAAAIAVGAVACNNDQITSLNVDPNNPTSAPAGPVFTYGARISVARWLGNGYDKRGTEWVAQHLAEWQYPQEDQYARLQGVDTQGNFDGPYTAELENLGKVAESGLQTGQVGIYGPALVLQTWDYDYLTDTFGDVPYSAALKGDSGIAGALAPAYDAQKDIYTGMFATLDKVRADIANDTSSQGLGSADPIYGGDKAKWNMFANSLLARLAMRVVNVDPATANAELTKAFSDPAGMITTVADEPTLNWPGDGVYDNGWADDFKTRDDHRMSQTFMKILSDRADPRTPIFAQPTQANPAIYAGMPNGLDNATAGNYGQTASKLGTIFYDVARPSVLMTAAEVNFIMAEAAERGMGGLTAAQAKGFYDAGIMASMEQWGVSSTAATTYVNSPLVTYVGGAAGLKQIAIQKYIALYGDGGQAWFECRRTCQPNTLVAGPAAIVNFVPRRYEYSTNEFSRNGASVNAAIAAMGGDTFDTRMYWDKNPTAAPTYVDPTSCAGARP